MSKEIMESKIKKAQLFIDEKMDFVKLGKMRQHYHFMAQVGWMNDPNGLIYFRGKYHFFFQYNPYNGFWDSMHWGHAISDDLLRWEYLPLALAPSEIYDNHLKGGCFSGSAIEHEGKLYLFYTASTNNGKGFEQTQCVAWSEDGLHFEKYENNPILEAPDGIAADQFRDPKVWKHEDSFYMVCGARKDNRAQALLYRSKDLINWTFFNVLSESRGEWGTMWECPDFYPMGEKFVLTFSPVSSGVHTSVYLIGDFDYKTGKFNSILSGDIDCGFDCYAPQSFLAPDGRRIIIGWANGWEWMPLWKDWGPTYKEGWCGFFNIPKEVRIHDNGTLQFIPIEELKELRGNPHKRETLSIGENDTELSAGDGISFEMKCKIDLEKTDADIVEFDFRCGEGMSTVCLFDLRSAELSVNRNNSDGWSHGISKSVLFLKGKEYLDVHVFSDQSSIEIFSDGYQNNHSNNIYASSLQNKIFTRTHNGKAIIYDYESYGLKECYR